MNTFFYGAPPVAASEQIVLKKELNYLNPDITKRIFKNMFLKIGVPKTFPEYAVKHLWKVFY